MEGAIFSFVNFIFWQACSHDNYHEYKFRFSWAEIEIVTAIFRDNSAIVSANLKKYIIYLKHLQVW